MSLSPADLAAVVDRYTVNRAREYWTHRRQYADWPHKDFPPQYITQYRHCPCGQSTPCPVHENHDTYGAYPDSFWQASPHDPHYAACLRHRDLPYRKPTEYL